MSGDFDFLSACVDADSVAVRQGEDEGRAMGLKKAFDSGRAVGEAQGRMVAFEIGHMTGVVQLLRDVKGKHAALFPLRHGLAIDRLWGMLGAFDVTEAVSSQTSLSDAREAAAAAAQWTEQLEQLRGKYKMMLSVLKMSKYINPHPEPRNKQPQQVVEEGEEKKNTTKPLYTRVKFEM